MRALVTGATGFVGSRLARRLIQDGAEVHALCRPRSDPWRLREALPQTRLHRADLLDAPALREVVRQARPEVVFHLAAAPVVAGTAAADADLVTVNLLGSVNLVEACETTDYRCLVNTGDAFEYGPAPGPLRESDPWRPDTLHGISKLAATLHAQAAARSRGRPIVTLRLFSPYGPGDHPRRLIPQVIAGALAGTPIALSRPDIVRDWLYVEDLVDLYLEASRTPGIAGGVFNAGSGREVSIAELVDAVRRITGSRAEARWGTFPTAPHDTARWVADMAHTFATFAWRPRTALPDGLRATVAAMQAAGDLLGAGRAAP